MDAKHGREPMSEPAAEKGKRFWRVYELRETGKPLRHELAVWVARGVRRKMRIPAEWSTRPETERERFARGAAIQMRELHRREASDRKSPEPSTSDAVTFDDFARLWTSGDLATRFPGHVRRKRTAEDDVQKLDVLKPWIGHVPLRDGVFTIEDAERALAKLSELKLAPATLRGYAQVIHRVCALAVYPAKLFSASPLPVGFLPDNGPPKAKSFVYPTEDAALLGWTAAPLERRMLYGVLGREGLRLGEALGLAWSDIDLERGTVSLDQNKTDDPRTWALGADVARALRLWRKLGRSGDSVFSLSRMGVDKRKLAGALRDDLEGAGVDRPALFAQSESRIALRVHDLRASFVTLALAAGRSEAWVTDRTGHRSSTMVAHYKRQVRTAAELELGWFSPLDEAIPELVKLRESETEPRDPVSERAAVSRECLAPPVSEAGEGDEPPDSQVVPTECTRRDLNPHTLRYRNLNPARLPIPPLVRGW